MARVVRGEAKERLLKTATDVMRAKGFAATTVDDVCAGAGVTKGAFFHHFESKEALAIAATERFAVRMGDIMARVESRLGVDRSTPRARVLAYVDARIALLDGSLAERTCLLGMVAQETFATQPRLRDASAAGMEHHLTPLVVDLEAALAAGSSWSDAGEARDLALHILAVVQGGFVIAKAFDDMRPAAATLTHLRRYLERVLPPDPTPENTS